MAAGRRDIDMTYIIFNNGVYGLTKGQASPTLRLWEKPKSLPNPNTNYNVNPIGLAITSGYTFVARAYSYDIRHLKSMITKAIRHQGTAFLDVLQPCPTYNDINTRDWYAGMDMKDAASRHSRIYKLEDTGYDPVVHYNDDSELDEKLSQALIRSLDWGNKIPIGVFYDNELISTFSERVVSQTPSYIENPPYKQHVSAGETPSVDVSPLIDSLRI